MSIATLCGCSLDPGAPSFAFFRRQALQRFKIEHSYGGASKAFFARNLGKNESENAAYMRISSGQVLSLDVVRNDGQTRACNIRIRPEERAIAGLESG